jgi:hypothetical protein
VSRTTVRHVVAAWLGGTPATNTPTDQNGNPLVYGQPSTVVHGVGTVYVSWPKDPSDKDFIAGMPEGTPSGARLVIHLPGPETETRAGQQYKKIERRVFIQVFHQSSEADAQLAQTDFDTLCDNLMARLRADPRMGTDAQSDDTRKIFGAGETPYGFRCEYTQPATNEADITEQYGQISFDVTDYIIGH